MARLRHYDYEGTVRFVTFGCYRNLAFFNDDRAKRIFLEELDCTHIKHGFRLLAYVIMPEHVHLVLHPPDGMPLGLVVREMKSCSAKALLRAGRSGKTGHQTGFLAEAVLRPQLPNTRHDFGEDQILSQQSGEKVSGDRTWGMGVVEL